MTSGITNFAQMTQRIKLSKELISLVHFVELNESGWVRKTLAKIILSILRSSPTALNATEIGERLKDASAHDFGISEVSAAIRALQSDQKIVERSKGVFQVREAEIQEIDLAIAATLAEDQLTFSRFCEVMTRNAPGVNGAEIWPQFLELYLTPLVQDAGASTLDLISGNVNNAASRENLQPFLELIEVSKRDEVVHAVIDFFDPSVSEVRQFILKRIAASFFVAAVSLDGKTIAALDAKRKKEISLKLFLDTNTLFSALSLHESDGNSDVQGLVALNRNPSANVKLKLFVFPETVTEATTVLSNVAASFGTHHYPPTLATAALRSNVSGVRAKYLEAAAQSDTRLSPKEYFSPYINNLASLLRAKGIEIIDRSLLVSRTDQEVVDDVLELEEWEKSHIAADRRKGYEAIMHDVYSWHCVNRYRPSHIDSPIDAQEWFITLDNRLLGFDAFKRKGGGKTVPVCIKPSTFIAYSQFWTPRSPEFEKALFGSLRLPLMFRQFDTHTEDVTLAILRRLSRFETVGDFSVDELQTLLLNDAVRSRFSEAKSEIEQQDLIQNQLLEIHAETVNRAKALSDLLAEEKLKKANLAEELERSNSELLSTSAQLDLERETSRKKSEEDAERIRVLDAEVAAQKVAMDVVDMQVTKRKALTQFFGICVVLPCIIAIAMGFFISRFIISPYCIYMGVSIFFIGVFLAVTKLAPSNIHIQSSLWLRRITRAVSFVYVPLAAFLLLTLSAMYQNFLQDQQPKMLDASKKAAESIKVKPEK